jgi:hypothetical protein
MWASSFAVCFAWGQDLKPYRSSKESDGTTWSDVASPGFTQGADKLGYDSDHHLLYSSNCAEGFWRVRTE